MSASGANDLQRAASTGTASGAANGSSRGRPPAYGRSATESSVQYQGNRSHISEGGRATLERNWSTSRLQEDDGEPRMVVPELNGSTALNQASLDEWASGSFSGFEAAHRDSTASASSAFPRTSGFMAPLRPSHRSASEGAVTRKSSIHGTQSAMHDAARLMQWDRVKDICRDDPCSASFVGQGGYTALHHLCSRRCPDVEAFEAVIHACPETLLMEESVKGWTPLHLACRFKCKSEAVRKLLTLFPEKGMQSASKPDRQRRTPLYYAVRYDAPPGVVPQVLEVAPSVVLADDQIIESPLSLVWDSFAEKLDGRRALNPFIGEQSSEMAPQTKRERLETQSDLIKRWKQANLFLKAAFGFPLNENEALTDTAERRWRILHATAAVKCHPTLFQMACALYPEQAREMDEDDLYGGGEGNETAECQRQTALHLAASSNATGPDGKAVVEELLRLYPDAASVPDSNGSYPLHRIVENRHKRHWTFDGVNPLYVMYPAAASHPDRQGRLPLHRAAAAVAHELAEGQNDAAELATRSIICNLLQVHPQAASALDMEGCHPLHLAAMSGGSWTDEVQALYAGHERAVNVRTRRGLNSSYPIHLAAANQNAQKSLVVKLVELNPRAASLGDGNGKLPLHLACEIGKSWDRDGVEAIYNAFAQAVRAREENQRRWLALHMASASRAVCTELIGKLIELNPEACEVRDSRGRLPFHLACEAGKKWEEGLSFLFEGNPQAISSLDDDGRLPLYIVADQYAASPSNDVKSGDLIGRLGLLGIDEVDEQEAMEVDVLFNLVRSDPTTIPE